MLSHAMWTQLLFQDGIRAGFETLIIPAFERSCQTMFDQVNTVFQTEMIEHNSQVESELASTHTALATNLQVPSERISILIFRIFIFLETRSMNFLMCKKKYFVCLCPGHVFLYNPRKF